jgi:hypothetical protein
MKILRYNLFAKRIYLKNSYYAFSTDSTKYSKSLKSSVEQHDVFDSERKAVIPSESMEDIELMEESSPKLKDLSYVRLSKFVWERSYVKKAIMTR